MCSHLCVPFSGDVTAILILIFQIIKEKCVHDRDGERESKDFATEREKILSEEFQRSDQGERQIIHS